MQPECRQNNIIISPVLWNKHRRNECRRNEWIISLVRRETSAGKTSKGEMIVGKTSEAFHLQVKGASAAGKTSVGKSWCTSGSRVAWIVLVHGLHQGTGKCTRTTEHATLPTHLPRFMPAAAPVGMGQNQVTLSTGTPEELSPFFC